MAFQIWPVFRVGVEAIKILRLKKVFVRSRARETGSASFLDAPGNLSTSSMKRLRIFVLARSAGLFAPVRYTIMSENFSASFLLSFFRHLSARTLQLFTIGSSVLSVVRSARSSDG